MLIAHSMSYLAGRVAPALLGFLSLAIFARLVSPTEFGEYSVVVATVLLVNFSLAHWLRMSLIRFYPAEGQPADRLMTSILLLYGSIIGTAGIVGGLGLLALTTLPPRLVLIGVALFWVWTWTDINLDLHRARLQPRKFGALFSLRSLLVLVFGSLFAWMGGGGMGLLLGSFVALACTGLWQFMAEWRHLKWTHDPAQTREIIRYGFPLSLNFSLTSIVNQSDRLMTGLLLGAAAAGFYSAVYSLTLQTMWVLMEGVNLATLPLAVRLLEQGDRTATLAHLKQGCTLLLVVALPSAVGLSLLAQPIVGFVLGQDFIAAATLLPLISIATVLRGLRNFYFDQSFQLSKQTTGQLLVMICAVVINLGLTVALVPLYGVSGVAWSAIATHAVSCTLSMLVGRRHFPMPLPGRDLLGIGLGCAIMALVILVFPTSASLVSLALCITSAGLAYAAVILALNVGDIRRTAQHALALASAKHKTP